MNTKELLEKYVAILDTQFPDSGLWAERNDFIKCDSVSRTAQDVYYAKLITKEDFFRIIDLVRSPDQENWEVAEAIVISLDIPDFDYESLPSTLDRLQNERL